MTTALDLPGPARRIRIEPLEDPWPGAPERREAPDGEPAPEHEPASPAPDREREPVPAGVR